MICYRCEHWINNCANEELTRLWFQDPDKIRHLRICQKHFPQEFIGVTGRLVSHAVPRPYGCETDDEQFKILCSHLREASDKQYIPQRVPSLSIRQPRTQPSSYKIVKDNSSTSAPISHENDAHHFYTQTFATTCIIQCHYIASEDIQQDPNIVYILES